MIAAAFRSAGAWGAIVFVHIFNVVIIIIMATVKLIIIVIGHQICFDIIDNLFKMAKEAIEIFLIEENFVAFVAITIKLFGTFSQRKIEVITFGSTNVEEVSSPFTSPYFFRIHALESPLAPIVIHVVKV